MRQIAVKIEVQGAVLVNHGLICARSKNLLAVEVDLGTKYAEIAAVCDGDGTAPSLMLCTSERTLHLAPKQPKEADTWTTISFPSLRLRGWNVWSAWIQRYTLRLCFRKESRSTKQFRTTRAC